MDKKTSPFTDVRFFFIIFACKKKDLIGDASSDLFDFKAKI